MSSTEIALGNLIQGMSYRQYHDTGRSLDALRAGDLKSGMKSMAHLKAARLNEKEPSDAMRFGALFHSAVEHPERFKDTYLVEPEFIGKTKDGKDSSRSAEAKAKKEAWYQDLKPGSIVVKPDEVVTLTGMLNAVMSHKIAGAMLKDSVNEQSLFVKDPELEIICQCRPDAIARHGHLIDIKTTRSAREDDFLRDIFSDRGLFYVLQAAHYAHCAKLAGLERHDSFTFIAVEKEPPFGVNVFHMDRGCLGVGDAVRDRISRNYATCIKEQKWPGYEEYVRELEPPSWTTNYEG